MEAIYDKLITKSKDKLHDIIDTTDLTEISWYKINENGTSDIKYIFKNSDNELIVSAKGNVKILKWEYLKNDKSIIIREEKNIQLYNKAFLCKDYIVLKKDSVNEYLLLISQEKNKELQQNKYISEPTEPIQVESINNDFIDSKLTNSKPLLNSMRKETEAMYFGISLLVFGGIQFFYFDPLFSDISRYEYSVFTLVSALIRLIALIWIVKIAKRLNRNELLWGLFAVFTPAIALVVIGNMSYSKSQP